MKQTSRSPLIDTLKALASQLIVLHHLAFYGPMSDIALPLAPDAISWFYDHARLAVQVFLVLAGFLAAHNLGPLLSRETAAHPLRLIWQRYCRLSLPLMAAVCLSILAAALARHWLSHDSIPDSPGLWQFLSHALLLQGVLEQEALSAGVWYVAIDFQLYLVLCLLLWLASKSGHSGRTALWLVAGLSCASLFYFNLDASWDDWGLYFFGAYGLGVLAQWGSRQPRRAGWIMAIASLGLAALLFEFRPRIALALATALLLLCCARHSHSGRWPEFRLSAWLGKISYSVFLVHFPVCLLINALFSRLAPDAPWLNLAGMLLAWLLSIAAGALFHRHIETGLSRIGKSAPSSPPLHTSS